MFWPSRTAAGFWPCCVRLNAQSGAIVAGTGLSQPAVSKHLRVLRTAGLVTVRSDAQRRLYRIRLEPLREMDEWLAPYREQWERRLDDLERHLDEMEDEGA